MRWIKLDLPCICFQKIKLTHCCFKSSPSICSSWIVHVDFLIFDPISFMLAQLALSHTFPLPGATSPLVDTTTPSHRVMLPFHWVKMSSLPPLHLSAMIYPVASPLEPKSKYWIRTTIAGHPFQTARPLPFTIIKRSSQSCSLSLPLNHFSILSPS
jgi:hypothetical protein